MLKDYAFYKNLMKEVDDGNVNFMDSACGEYRIFKYSMNCHMASNWNEYNREARGVIFHIPTQTLVCRPFAKFFNLDEVESTKLENLPNEPFQIFEKLDGSCVSTWVDKNGSLRCATPGSIESTQAKWAEEWFKKHFEKLDDLLLKAFIEANKYATFIFEAIYPENRNVVDYSTRTECVLLSVRIHSGQELTQNNVDEVSTRFKFSRPKRYTFDLSRTLMFPENEEGYVVLWPHSNLRLKIKSPEYVRLHRIKDTFNIKGVCEVLAEGRLSQLMEVLPKHMQKEADDIASLLRSKFYDYKLKIEDIYNMVKTLPSRKEQALTIQAKCPRNLWGCVFSMLDNNYLDRQLWRIIYGEL